MPALYDSPEALLAAHPRRDPGSQATCRCSWLPDRTGRLELIASTDEVYIAWASRHGWEHPGPAQLLGHVEIPADFCGHVAEYVEALAERAFTPGGLIGDHVVRLQQLLD